MNKTSYHKTAFNRRIKGILLALCFFMVAGGMAAAENDSLWIRYPALSPDGSTIVFSYQGNLFQVASQGGTAVPLTMHPAYDFQPVWSKNGRFIAFASNRYGNFDIFMIAADGGAPLRLTHHSADDMPYSFSPDDAQVIFSSSRLDLSSNMMFPTGSLPEL